MGYELHVRRLGEHGATDVIPEHEWLAFVRDAPDFVLRDGLSTSTPMGERVRFAGPVGCWTGHPSVELVPFTWREGAVHVTLADQHGVTGALRVARALAATVVGDDGEHYDEPTDADDAEPAWRFPDPDEQPPVPVPAPAPAPAPTFGTSPPIEDVAFDFDGQATAWERLTARFRRRT